MTKVIAVIQARMSSTRLPGKVLKESAGRPLLAWQLARVTKANCIDEVWVATSRNSEDDAIEALCNALNVPCYRGSLNNVLDRYVQVAALTQADHIVRLTADCPLHDASVIDAITTSHLQQQAEFSNNSFIRSLPDGLDVEIASKEALHKVEQCARNDWDREHVFAYIYEHKEEFKCNPVVFEPDTSDQRWTVDYPDDFKFVDEVFSRLGQNPYFSYRDVLQLLNKEPSLLKINAHHKE